MMNCRAKRLCGGSQVEMKRAASIGRRVAFSGVLVRMSEFRSPPNGYCVSFSSL